MVVCGFLLFSRRGAMPSWVRASTLDRLATCSGPLVLPRVESPSGEGAHWGNSCHLWSETGQISASSEYPNHQKLLEKKLSQYDRLQLWPDGTGVYREPALARNTETGQCKAKFDGNKEEKEAWKAAFGDEWETGTADYVRVTDVVYVDDLKTGKDLPECLLQLSWYSTVLSILFGVPQGEVSVTHIPRYPVANDPKRYYYKPVAAPDMLAKMDELRKVYEEKQAKYKVTFSCRFCACKDSCVVLSDYLSKGKKEGEE